jgi:hypothetical protein
MAGTYAALVQEEQRECKADQRLTCRGVVSHIESGPEDNSVSSPRRVLQH